MTHRGREAAVSGSFFASSLLSLISPWAGAPCRRWRDTPPARPPRTPQVPPPPSRRHSIPPSHTKHSPNTARTKHRRYSDIRNPPVSKLDLRQELLNLNLGTQEFDSWIGDKFEENEEYENELYYERFEHNILLQRSISLDRGIDIFNHLRNIGSDTTGSVGSVWTVDSDGKDSMSIERYRSFEDIPTSPYKVRSRRASFGVETFSERNIALAVLNESYKCLDVSGSVSPQIRKLQRCFTFSGTFDCIKENKSAVENSEVNQNKPNLKLVIPKTDGNIRPVTPEIRRLKDFSFQNSADDIETKMSDDEDQELETQKPYYRSISVEWSQGDGENRARQRRSGRFAVNTDLRKKVLVKQECKSSENLIGRRRESFELATSNSHIQKTLNLEKLKSNISSGNTDTKVLPTIIISHSDSNTSGVAKISKTSNYVDLSRNCDCRICNEGDSGCFIPNVLSKLFVKIFSCREFSRKCCWDENNNLKDSEMYNCIMHLLKLLLGLWVRHLDHN